ncbi:glycine--tRNA ligase subunit beta [Evansella clarkii]|uniref:glycine--tRNA ligase subunit beta n=1 Tax=Evansella clarkii TaxID=79879 RepID=UPI000B44F38E|nr:glycine--tRNA ligase subunit beta [Evansella clarkii]
MNNRNFLLEIGLEEMPARFVTDAMNQLAEKAEKWLEEQRLSYKNIEKFSTPRRLAVIIHGLSEKQADKEEEAKGPAKKIALDQDGNWTKAAQGFARGQKVSVDDLFFRELKGEEYVFVKKFTEGQPAEDLLSGFKDVLLNLQFPKNMKWADYNLKYIRPVKWLIALYGNEVIDFEIAEVKTGNISYGHRFLGGEVVIDNADSYREILLGQFVLTDPQERKDAIRSQLMRLSESEAWDIPVDENLLEEVNNLVEYPAALYGEFDERFLQLPDEVLITSMREHQRYFPVKNTEGKLLPYFVTVRNGDHRHLENVQKGNEKVLRARLADAEFFYEEDKKQPLENRLKRLESIVYHEELGSMGDKVRRIKELALQIGERAGFDAEELKKAERAASLSKADLVTNMVNEFPELEGRMGQEYAVLSGEEEEVAAAIYEHYLPKQAGDKLPATRTGALISVADKADTVVSSFGIGLKPTGSQDPHGLRRQTAGIVQVILSQNWELNIFDVLEDAINLAEKRGHLKRSPELVMDELKDFLELRIKSLLQEQGVRYDVIDAVLKTNTGDLELLFTKASFLMNQLAEPDFKNAVEAFSRVTNIAKKAGDNQGTINTALLKEEEEKQLQELRLKIGDKVSDLLKQGNVEDAYKELRSLEPVIHKYFDNIMVMADNPEIKRNRLAQMNDTADLITRFADFQSIVFHGEE